MAVKIINTSMNILSLSEIDNSKIETMKMLLKVQDLRNSGPFVKWVPVYFS
jgi:hypothetical protein